ncbi:MFS transporter-like protein [Xylogone sp. PMI_703]|nr:MFS transporter-like protein [Xylogone sp. PMI_703]
MIREDDVPIHDRLDSLDLETTISIPPSRRSTKDLEHAPDPNPSTTKSEPVSWLSLPRKSQLVILFLCRLVDFLQVASLQPYIFYQLKSFDTSLSDSQLASQVGILQGSFTGAQVMTAMLWGRVADSSIGGRKLVLLVGLGGTAASCLGYGFATTFAQAILCRVFGGAVNGTVGIIRTIIGEIIIEKKYQSRAFLILPMSFNVAGILGPVMGGLLADPANTLPGLFGQGAVFEIHLLRKYPYALPNILNFIFLMTAFAIVFFGLEETLKERKGEPDFGLYLAKRLRAIISRSRAKEYSQLENERELEEPTISDDAIKAKSTYESPPQKLSFRRIWTPNVIFTLATITLFEFHLGAFTNLWSLFLSTPRPSPSDLAANPSSLPFSFTGGLGMPASTVGLATSILGLLGMALQLSFYPRINSHLGTLRSLQFFLPLFPIAYFLAPYLAVLPSSSAFPDTATGVYIWIGITLVLFLQVTARTFTLPASIILLNNCSPHPSVLGTVHGLGQSISAASRTIGPLVSSWWYGVGLDIGLIGTAWWGVAAVAASGCIIAVWMYEGSGHEILLEGEREDDDVEMEGGKLRTGTTDRELGIF